MTGLSRHSVCYTKRIPGLKTFSAMALSCVFAAGCAAPGSDISGDPSNPAARVASLQIVDCLLPGMVRKLGNTQYLTPRRPVRTTAADCSIRGGEYTAYDRADYKSALAVWMPEAEAGNAQAQTNVGQIFERGLGGEPNYEAAAFWYEKAAKQSNSRAQFNLGTLYEQGLGVPKDRLKALNWYRDAWGMPADSLIYQSVANKEADQLRAELSRTIDQRDARIHRLERDLGELQKRKKTQGADQAVLQKEIEDLGEWIDTLENERSTSLAQLSALPKMREPSQRPVQPRNTSNSGHTLNTSGLDFGRYFALIIGNQDYSKIESLDSPEHDAMKMAELLRDKYGFGVEVFLNVNNIQLMEKINDLNETLNENDNLLIYYAGHGARVKTGGMQYGYWLPINADPPPRNTYWVANEFVTRHLSRLQARRVLVIADSCYAGLLSDAPSYLMLKDAPEYTEEFLRYKLPKRSRLLLSSGGDEPVMDDGASGHSVFANALLETLQSNEEILSGPQLFAAIQKQVLQNSTARGMAQKPEFKVIKGAGHEVGDFFFVPI
jgi:hypothetical protein